MNQKKVDGRKNLRPKSEIKFADISQPFHFKHHLHVGQEDVNERAIDTDVKPLSPQKAGLFGTHNSGDSSITRESISQIIKQEVVPVLYTEIGDIIEDKIRKLRSELDGIPKRGHCITCRCVENEKRNTAYSVLDQDRLTKIKGKYSSEVNLAHTTLKDNPSVLSRTNTLPVPSKLGQSLLMQDNKIPKVLGLRKPDERECLANALHFHIEELVDGIVFKDSELPDLLLEDGCITDDECAGMRYKFDRKDQIRVLLSLLKGRDLDVMLRFLKHLRNHNQNVVKKIEEKFEENKKKGLRSSKCALCRLTSQVNLKYIIDYLWKFNLIDDGIFNLIVYADKPIGAQHELWQCVIDSLNKVCDRNSSEIRYKLTIALTRKNHYSHISQGIEWMLINNGTLACRCDLSFNNVSTFSINSRSSSWCPRTSESELDSKSDSSHASNITENSSVQDVQKSSMNHSSTVKVPGKASHRDEDDVSKAVQTEQQVLSAQTEPETLIQEHNAVFPNIIPVMKMVKIFERKNE